LRRHKIVCIFKRQAKHEFYFRLPLKKQNTYLKTTAMEQPEIEFTLNQIHEAYSKVKSGADFPQFVQDLKAIGVSHYDNFVADGNTCYYGTNTFILHGTPKYPTLNINSNSSAEKLKHAITIHQQSQTDYPTFCLQAAEAGVEKWTTHLVDMTVTYLNKQGEKLTVEQIPMP
jgi:uncharacterized protein YbcV (DUF1398 family)